LLAEMANQEHLDILAQGVEVWNEWVRADLFPFDLRGANLAAADLRHIKLFSGFLDGANLERADLTGADLRSTSMSAVNLRGAKLNGAIMTYCGLQSADLTDAELFLTNLSDANLRDSTLTNAGLIQTNLDRGDLRRADLTAARLNGAILTRANLTDAIGLESCLHLGPVAIDFYTLAISGDLPLRFKRGCGLPDRLIEYLPSLLGAAFDFYSCFISYSTRDQEFADRLYADLQAKGVRCWFAPHDIQAGKKIHEQIDEAIKVYDKLLLILSDASMNSNWVRTEISNARAKEEHQQRQMLFPIALVPFDCIKAWKLFDADTGIDSAREIREYFIPDFSNWKDHDSYATAFERLVRDLKANPAKPVLGPAP
jgi:TIR domain/Pentapeptide repeats (8 copies)